MHIAGFSDGKEKVLFAHPRSLHSKAVCVKSKITSKSLAEDFL